MAGFKVCPNRSDSKASFPYLLDVQTDLLSTLDTTMVIPLTLRRNLGPRLIRNLNPTLLIGDDEYVVLTQQMAAVPRAIVGSPMVDVEADRSAVLSSIDFLITGI